MLGSDLVLQFCPNRLIRSGKIDGSDHTNDSIWSFRDADFSPRDIQLRANLGEATQTYPGEFYGQYEYSNLTSGDRDSSVFLNSSLNGTILHSTALNITDGTIKGYINGELQVVDSNYINPIDNYLELWLMSNRGGSRTLTGNFCEIIILNIDDISTMRKIEGHLARKWGILDKLDNTHDYKFKAPTM